MKTLFIICIVAAGWQAALCQNKTVEELHQLNSQFIQNFIRKDTVLHNQIIHPDNFLFIDSDGLLVDRQGYMKKCANGYDSALLRDFRYADEK